MAAGGLVEKYLRRRIGKKLLETAPQVSCVFAGNFSFSACDR
jgi:hypothetical protein